MLYTNSIQFIFVPKICFLESVLCFIMIVLPTSILLLIPIDIGWNSESVKSYVLTSTFAHYQQREKK